MCRSWRLCLRDLCAVGCRCCDYGELPLHFAACTNQKHLVDYLVERGASLQNKTAEGQTILHLIVLHRSVLVCFARPCSLSTPRPPVAPSMSDVVIGQRASAAGRGHCDAAQVAEQDRVVQVVLRHV